MGLFDIFKKKKKEEESSYNLDDVSSKLQSKKDDTNKDAMKNLSTSEVDSIMDEYDREIVENVEVEYAPSVLEEVYEERKTAKVDVPVEIEAKIVTDKEAKLSYFEEVIHEIMDSKLTEEQIKDLREAFEIKYAPIKSLMEAYRIYSSSGQIPEFSNGELIRLLNLLPKEQENVFLPYLVELKELGIATDEEIKSIKNKYGSGEIFKLNYTQGALYLERLGLIDIADETVFEKSFDKNSIYKRHLIKIVSDELNQKDKEKTIVRKAS